MLNIDQFIEALEIDEEIEERFGAAYQRELFLEHANRVDPIHGKYRLQLLKEHAEGVPLSGEKGLRRKLGAVDLEYYGRAYLPHYFTRPSPAFHNDLNQIWTEGVLKNLNPIKTKTAREINRLEGSLNVIAAPRGHAKSTNLTFKDALHATCYAYKHYILILSDSSDQAEGFLADIKLELEDNPLIREDFGELQGKRGWTDSSITTAHGVKIDAIGSGKKVRGRRFRNWRPDLIILDDVENDENVNTPDQRDKLDKWFKNAVSKAGDTYTDIIFIGTVLHYDSLLVKVLNNASYRAVKYQGVISWAKNQSLWDAWEVIYGDLSNDDRKEDSKQFFEDNREAMLEGTEVLWAEKQDYYALMVSKATTGPASFSAEIQNEPIDPASATFNDEWFDYYNPLEIDFKDKHFLFVGAVDPSLAKKKKSDYSTIIVLAVDTRTGYMYVYDCSIERRHPDIIIEDTFAAEVRLRADRGKGMLKLGVEAVQFQHFFKDEMAKRSAKAGLYMPVEPIDNYSDKNMRIKRLQPFVKNRYLKFNPSHKTLLQQMREHPMGGHDDGPDALEMAVRLAETVAKRASDLNYETVSRRRMGRITGAY